MKNTESVHDRVVDLLREGKKLEYTSMYAMIGTEEYMVVQTWLNRAVLVIYEALSASHPFRQQSAAYMSGGGQLGVQGMLALLDSLRAEIEAGTFS